VSAGSSCSEGGRHAAGLRGRSSSVRGVSSSSARRSGGRTVAPSARRPRAGARARPPRRVGRAREPAPGRADGHGRPPAPRGAERARRAHAERAPGRRYGRQGDDEPGHRAGLFVTPKTVEVHLSSVYRKLGICSRAQLRGRARGGSLRAGAPSARLTPWFG
jgi:hypothetical protein